MKKLLLSALVISAMFVSCGKDDAKGVDTPEAPPKGAFKEIKYIQDNIHKVKPEELLKAFDKFKEEVAKGKEYTREKVLNNFVTWIRNVTPEGDAQKGKAGKFGKKPRYINEKGIEIEQLIKKGFIGAFQLNSAYNAWKKLINNKKQVSEKEQQEILEEFATALIGSYENIDNEKIEINSHGVKYGYKISAGNEFAKYLNVVSSGKYPQFKNLSTELYSELKDAKKNIGDVSKLERNLAKALNIAQTVTAIRGVQYLKEAKNLQAGGSESAFHSVSEGLGFIYSLQFATIDPITNFKRLRIDYEDIEKLFDKLDLWDVATTQALLKDFGKNIAYYFEFDYDTVDATE